MTIGERMKACREKKGISQIELATAANITKQSLYKYENNIVTNIPSDKIEAIAYHLNTTPAYLMGWEPESKAPETKEAPTEQEEEYKRVKSLLADMKAGRTKPAAAVIGFGGHGQEVLDITEDEYEMIKAMLKAKHDAEQRGK